ncbi:MAG TPA: amino acid ABC transporter permease [Actinomycetota bacterium]|nr:amino acid ABC transporter permease [Actinomycetota bacterium]
MVRDGASGGVEVRRRGVPGLLAVASGPPAAVLAALAPAADGLPLPGETLQRLVLPLAAIGILTGAAELLEVHRVRPRAARVGIVASVAALAIVVARLVGETADLGRIGELYFNLESVRGLGPAFARGVWNTVRLSVLAEIGGIAIGLSVALVAISRRWFVRAPAVVYVDLFRGTPLLVQLSFIYFGLALIGIRLDAFMAGLAGLALNSGAYVAEIFRAGIQSVDRGQMEAARGLGMPHRAAMRYVIVPQAVRRVMPPLTNEFIALLKDSSLVAVLGAAVGGRELYKVARDAYSSTFSATPFVVASLLYLCMTVPLTRVVNRLERGLRSP